MKSLWLGMIVAVSLGGVALADDPESDQNWISPKRDVLVSQWPKDAKGGLIYGEVKLDCGVNAKGFAAACTVKSEEPAGRGLAAAALRLAALHKARAPSQPRSVLDIDLTSDTLPDWLRKPTFDQLMATYPQEAGKKGKSGMAKIRCWVQLSGLLRSCTVINESPPGLGFGSAALVLAPTMLMKPATRQGQPVESEVTIPIVFKLDYPLNIASSKSIMVMSQVVWAKAPTMTEILSALDKKVGDKFAQGRVAYQCAVDRGTGRLHDCVVANVSADMVQFQGVAHGLTSKFQVDPAAVSGIKDDVVVNLNFGFPDMASEIWNKRYLTHPQWTRTISPEPGQPLFPQEAVKAGLKEGSAMVDCVVGADGGLTQCAIVSESVPGVGLGVMAQKIAESFAANLWTEDGLPAEGAHVRMPIKLVDMDAKAATPSTPPTPPAASPGSPPPVR